MPGRVATHTVNRWAGWDELNRGGHGGHVFNSRSMLELAGAGTAICAELPGGEYGAFPVPARDREVRQPSYCFPYFGPVYGTWSGTAPRVAVTRRRILGQILQHLCDQYDYIALPLHPCHTDMVPFIQAGFLVEVRYTYVHNLTTPESTWTANMSSNRLRDLRKTLNNRICFTPDPGCERFNFRNAGFWTDDDAVVRTIQSQVRSLVGSSEGMPFIALDPNGELQGQIFVAWDATRAYALYSWANCSQTSRGVPTRLYWEAMRFVRDNTVARLFDFEGSVVWGVEAFYQSFGGQQVPYYKVYWAKDQSQLPTNPYRY